MDTLNPQQRAAAEFQGKHLLVLAGAGTGKTRTIIARARHLIQNGVDPSRILILSFTRKSANEIVSRIALEFSGRQSEGLQGLTFHSWCMSIIKSNPHIFPQANFTVLDEDDRQSCIKLICGRSWRGKKQNGRRLKPEEIIAVYSYAVNAMCPLSQAIRMVMFDNAPDDMDVEAERQIVEGVIKLYLEYKKNRRYIDYDDILLIVSKYLQRHEPLRSQISSLYDHILIDEMQDTNPLQYELLSSFLDRCHLFCVGDDAQSIYAFRGADFQAVHRFSQLVPESQTLKLTLNYRSTQQILDLSNWLLRQSPLKYEKDLVAARGSGLMPEVIHWDSEWEEARDIASKMLAAQSEHGLRWSDHLVLGRSKFSLRKVESQLIKEKIPYQIFGGTGIMASAHIRDVVSSMRIVANYLDEIAWSRYLQLWEGIGPVTAAKIVGKVIETESFDEALYRLMRMNLQKEIAETLTRVNEVRFNPDKAVEEALQVMEARLRQKYKEEWEWRSEDFPILKEVARNSASINEFVAEYVLDPKLELSGKEKGKPDDVVTLSTIHSAKGLEADSVYLVNASARSYPTPRALLNGTEAVEEERRCLYVALTRAKNRLYIYRDLASVHEVNHEYFLHNLPAYLYTGRSLARNGLNPTVGFIDPLPPTDIYDDFNFN